MREGLFLSKSKSKPPWKKEALKRFQHNKCESNLYSFDCSECLIKYQVQTNLRNCLSWEYRKYSRLKNSYSFRIMNTAIVRTAVRIYNLAIKEFIEPFCFRTDSKK